METTKKEITVFQNVHSQYGGKLPHEIIPQVYDTLEEAIKAAETRVEYIKTIGVKVTEYVPVEVEIDD